MEEGGDSNDEVDESNEEMEADEVDGDEKDKDASDKDASDKDVSDKDDEEPSNLQLAWEMLEVAKVAYTKQIESSDAGNKNNYEEMLCKSMMALGEVSIENENYSQAVEDMQLCLQKKGS